MTGRSRFPLCGLHVSIFLMLTTLAGCSNPSDSPLVALEKARILIDRGQADEAVPLISRAIDSLPQDAQARYLRGVAYENLNLEAKALEDYSECLKLNPERTDALNNKAVVLARMERFEEAAAEFTKLLQLNPQDALAFRNRGLCRFDQQQYDLALADYNQAIELAPRAPANWFQRGNVFLEQDLFEQAESDYSQAIELDPDFARAWMNRGVARYQDGRKAAATEDLQMAQTLDNNIILPGLDFFRDEPDPNSDLWTIVRATADVALADRGFSELMLLQEYPAFWCAKFSAQYRGTDRVVLVTCIRSGHAGMLLPTTIAPSIDVESDELAESSPAMSLLILTIDEVTTTSMVHQFKESWAPDSSKAHPVILQYDVPADQ